MDLEATQSHCILAPATAINPLAVGDLRINESIENHFQEIDNQIKFARNAIRRLIYVERLTNPLE